MGSKKFEDAIVAARKRSAAMDEIDRRNGFSTPTEVPASLVPTAMSALEAAISVGDWDCVADAYVLLEKVNA